MPLFFIFLLQWVETTLPWLAPLVVSSLTGSVAGYGSFRFGQGELRQRLSNIEGDVVELKTGQGEFVTRHEFDLLRSVLNSIQTDVREIRRSVTR